MRKKTVARRLVLAVVMGVVAGGWYLGAWSPYAKARAFASAVRSEGSGRVMDVPLRALDAALNSYSPVGQDQLVSLSLDRMIALLASGPPLEEGEKLLSLAFRHAGPVAANAAGPEFASVLLKTARLFQIGWLLYRRDDLFRTAEFYLSQGRSLIPTQPEFLYRLRDLYLAHGDSAQADITAEEILRRWPDDQLLRNRLYARKIPLASGLNWTLENSQFGSRAVTSIGYGAGLFVAVGLAGTLATSPDGGAWTIRQSQFGLENIYAIAYGGGLFVVGGSNGTVATSPDGKTWTRGASGLQTGIRGLAHGANLFVATGGNGALATSPDGINWTPRLAGMGTAGINGVAYASSGFVIVGERGSLSTSPGGVTWTARSSGFGSSPIYRVLRGDRLFVAAGAAGKLATSPDGVQWTMRTSGFEARFIASLAYGSGMYIAGGEAGGLATSTDGITWDLRESPFGPRVAIRGIAHDDGVFVSGGDAGTVARATR